MAEINHTQSHDAVKGISHEEGYLKYSFLDDDDLLTVVWNRDINNVDETVILLHELSFRFEMALTYW